LLGLPPNQVLLNDGHDLAQFNAEMDFSDLADCVGMSDARDSLKAQLVGDHEDVVVQQGHLVGQLTHIDDTN
jgi:hypothetical protein